MIYGKPHAFLWRKGKMTESPHFGVRIFAARHQRQRAGGGQSRHGPLVSLERRGRYFNRPCIPLL